jgi:hypothetical protein
MRSLWFEALEQIQIEIANFIPYKVNKEELIMKFEGTWHITEMENWKEDTSTWRDRLTLKLINEDWVISNLV